MIVAVASGKGGTGKTTIASSLSLALSEDNVKVSFLDCDVEEPNGHLLLGPALTGTETVNVQVPDIDVKKCDNCGFCAEICAFNALAILEDAHLIFPELCHSCGGCWHLCPQNAVNILERGIGVVEMGNARGINFVHGRLNIGEVMSPSLIKAVKRYIERDQITIIDAPPGTSCPAITAIEGVDFCLLIAEPTPFGVHDMNLVVEMLAKVGIPAGVVINRSDGEDGIVEQYCRRKKLPVLASFPLQKDIAKGYALGIPALEIRPQWKMELVHVIERIKGMLGQ